MRNPAYFEPVLTKQAKPDASTTTASAAIVPQKAPGAPKQTVTSADGLQMKPAPTSAGRGYAALEQRGQAQAKSDRADWDTIAAQAPKPEAPTGYRPGLIGRGSDSQVLGSNPTAAQVSAVRESRNPDTQNPEAQTLRQQQLSDSQSPGERAAYQQERQTVNRNAAKGYWGHIQNAMPDAAAAAANTGRGLLGLVDRGVNQVAGIHPFLGDPDWNTGKAELAAIDQARTDVMGQGARTAAGFAGGLADPVMYATGSMLNPATKSMGLMNSAATNALAYGGLSGLSAYGNGQGGLEALQSGVYGGALAGAIPLAGAGAKGVAGGLARTGLGVDKLRPTPEMLGQVPGGTPKWSLSGWLQSKFGPPPPTELKMPGGIFGPKALSRVNQPLQESKSVNLLNTLGKAQVLDEKGLTPRYGRLIPSKLRSPLYEQMPGGYNKALEQRLEYVKSLGLDPEIMAKHDSLPVDVDLDGMSNDFSRKHQRVSLVPGAGGSSLRHEIGHYAHQGTVDLPGSDGTPKTIVDRLHSQLAKDPQVQSLIKAHSGTRLDKLLKTLGPNRPLSDMLPAEQQAIAQERALMADPSSIEHNSGRYARLADSGLPYPQVAEETATMLASAQDTLAHQFGVRVSNPEQAHKFFGWLKSGTPEQQLARANSLSGGHLGIASVTEHTVDRIDGPYGAGRVLQDILKQPLGSAALERYAQSMPALTAAGVGTALLGQNDDN